eukprot:5577244-Prymnesium_polylepis.1
MRAPTPRARASPPVQPSEGEHARAKARSGHAAGTRHPRAFPRAIPHASPRTRPGQRSRRGRGPVPNGRARGGEGGRQTAQTARGGFHVQPSDGSRQRRRAAGGSRWRRRRT